MDILNGIYIVFSKEINDLFIRLDGIFMIEDKQERLQKGMDFIWELQMRDSEDLVDKSIRDGVSYNLMESLRIDDPGERTKTFASGFLETAGSIIFESKDNKALDEIKNKLKKKIFTLPESDFDDSLRSVAKPVSHEGFDDGTQLAKDIFDF